MLTDQWLIVEWILVCLTALYMRPTYLNCQMLLYNYLDLANCQMSIGLEWMSDFYGYLRQFINKLHDNLGAFMVNLPCSRSPVG